MGLYSVVKIREHCSSCGNFAELRVQFKYGDLWNYEYEPGDSIIWGNNNNGEPGHKRVVVYGVAERCPNCNAEGGEYEVWIEDDRIVAVRPISGKYNFPAAHETYIVLEE